MSMMPLNEENLLLVPKRAANEEINRVRQVYILPSRRKHISGLRCMDLVAERINHELVRFGGGREVITLVGDGYKITFPTKRMMVVYNDNPFKVTNDLSDLKFIV